MHLRTAFLTFLICATHGTAMAQASTAQAPSSGQGAPHGVVGDGLRLPPAMPRRSSGWSAPALAMSSVTVTMRTSMP